MRTWTGPAQRRRSTACGWESSSWQGRASCGRCLRRWGLAQRVGQPNTGVVVDTYHLYAGLSKSEDLELFAPDPSRLFFVHVSDVDADLPRDLWTVPDRTLPGAGGIPNAALVERVRALGYDADISLELFSARFEARWDADPVAAARLAYERCTALVPDATLA